jgi:hypothetical protein
MLTRSPEPTDECSLYTLRPWQLRLLELGKLCVIGYCVENGRGQVVSEVVALDIATNGVVAGTGQLYRLGGPPGPNVDADRAWDRWALASGTTKWADVSAELWDQHISSKRTR